VNCCRICPVDQQQRCIEQVEYQTGDWWGISLNKVNALHSLPARYEGVIGWGTLAFMSAAQSKVPRVKERNKMHRFVTLVDPSEQAQLVLCVNWKSIVNRSFIVINLLQHFHSWLARCREGRVHLGIDACVAHLTQRRHEIIVFGSTPWNTCENINCYVLIYNLTRFSWPTSDLGPCWALWLASDSINRGRYFDTRACEQLLVTCRL